MDEVQTLLPIISLFGITINFDWLILQSAPPLIGRFVPFAAVAAANCVNIPLMRQTYVDSSC